MFKVIAGVTNLMLSAPGVHMFTVSRTCITCCIHLQHPCSGWGALANIAFGDRHERCRKRLRQAWLRDRRLQDDVIAEVQRLTKESQQQHQTDDKSGKGGQLK